MIEYLEHIDRALFLTLNGWHSPFLDYVMWYVSARIYWIPLYIILLVMIFRRFGWKNTLVIILTISAVIAATDQTAYHFFKLTFERLRPSHNPEIEHLVHSVNGYKGGVYGFVSNHAANSFALAVFVSLIFRTRWVILGMLFWAVLIGYSRIYLGVHYPGDIIGGVILGSAFAFAS